jgi:hypothetical protein
MATYRLSARASASPERVFDRWIDLEGMVDWVGGVTRVSDVSGPVDRAGTTYTVRFGGMASRSEVLEATRPSRFRTRFGNWLLRGENVATFSPDGDGTRIDQEFRTQGLVPAVTARIFSLGSYKGSFQGELNEFVRLVEAEAAGLRSDGTPA